MTSQDISPLFMLTVVAFPEVRNGLIDPLLPDHANLRGIPGDDLVRASYKARFVPLITTAAFPAQPTRVAVTISNLVTTKDGQGTRIVHYKGS